HLPVHPRRGPPDGPRWADRLPLLGRCHEGAPVRRGLRRDQGRDRGVHPGRSARAGTARHPGERHRTRGDLQHPVPGAGPGRAGQRGRTDPALPRRQRCGRRRGGSIPRLRRRRLHHRAGDHRGRRRDRPSPAGLSRDRDRPRRRRAPMTIALDGVTAVLVTPYSGGTDRVDEAAVTAIAAHAAAAGIPVLTALGNTAEVQQLTDEERRTVLRGVAAVDHPVTRIAGVCGGLRTALAEIETAAGLGYQAAMVHEPADPFGDGDGLTRYYQQLAASAPLPIVLYLRSTRLTAAHLAELVALPGVVGVKYARPDLHSLAGLLAGPA